MGDGGSIALSMVHVSVSVFPLPTILFIPSLQEIKGITPAENCHDLFTSCCRKLRRLNHCHL